MVYIFSYVASPLSFPVHSDAPHRPNRGRAWLFRLWGVLLCVSLLNGCAAGFLWHVSVGQAKLLARRQPVEEVLRDGTLSEQKRVKLRLIQNVRKYAIEQLGLHANGSYTTYVDVGGPYVTYNVSAAPKDALQPYVWRFPIVGRVPYKGYFNQAAARRQARKLREQDYDTYVRGVRAYSTLGYFADPILSSMLASHEIVLIRTIIHELVHQTVWVKGSVSFNESLADFVAEKGALAYLAQRDGTDAPIYKLYQDTRADARIFQAYMHDIVARLETLYQGPLSRDDKLRQREHIFVDAQRNYPAVFPRMKTAWYRRYFEGHTLNNAVLLAFRRYHRDTTFFDQALAAHGGDLRRMIVSFKTLRPDDIPVTFRTR